MQEVELSRNQKLWVHFAGMIKVHVCDSKEAAGTTSPLSKHLHAKHFHCNSCSSTCLLRWSVRRGGTAGPPQQQHNICEAVMRMWTHIEIWNDLPGIHCWVVRWEESPADCGASERIPSLTWGNSTSKSPCGARTDADDAQMKRFKILNSLQSGASCVFLLHLASRWLWLLVKIITL